MLYIDLYEDLIKEDAVVDILDINKKDTKNPVARVEVGETILSIPAIDETTTVGKFRDMLNNSIRKSIDSNIEPWKGGQITLGGVLKNNKNKTLKQVFPTFPEPIEFILQPGEHQQGVKPEDTPHVLMVNDESAMRR